MLNASTIADATGLVQGLPAEAVQAKARHGRSQAHKDQRAHMLPILCLDGPYPRPFKTCLKQLRVEGKPLGLVLRRERSGETSERAHRGRVYS